jgi:signal transduction histidine kinase
MEMGAALPFENTGAPSESVHMLNFQVRRWSGRPRMLVFMLGVMLPAAALIVVGIWQLRTIQREKAIEAVFQREYQQVLAISEKRIDVRAYEIAEEASSKFPDAKRGDELEAFLSANPDIAHAFLWTGKGHVKFQSQPSQMSNPDFEADGRNISSMVGGWFDLEAKDLIEKLKKIKATEGRRVYFTSNWVPRGDKFKYQSLVLFIPRGSTAEHPALAGFVYDTDYLSNKFFPQALDEVLPNQNASDTSHPQPVIMVRTSKEQAPFASSMCWDGGLPEVERGFENVFPGLILGIKLRGTTFANISNHFARTEYIILGALSLLMGGGLLLAYRNVTRELALAKLKSDFVSNVSHELRTPLALIRLYAETLELGRIPNPEKRQEYYEIIRKESERLTSLINNILDFSRIESGKKEYSFRETDVADLVRDTLESYRFEIEQNGFQFEQKIDGDLPQVWVDREAIARSLLNLVNNAVKYSATEKYLGVNLYRHNGGVNLEVVDHGIGIPAKEQPKIFEKFYRVCDPLVHDTKGSGLGLSLVRHIVQAHGGEVAVESEPGHGSKFIITLPVLTPEIQQAKGMSA